MDEADIDQWHLDDDEEYAAREDEEFERKHRQQAELPPPPPPFRPAFVPSGSRGRGANERGRGTTYPHRRGEHRVELIRHSVLLYAACVRYLDRGWVLLGDDSSAGHWKIGMVASTV